MEERRSKERFSVWFPLTVITDDGEEGTAITFDVSAAGLLMACAGRLDEGAHVQLRFDSLGSDDEPLTIGAKILRVTEQDFEAGPWRYKMAVEYDEPHPDLEGVVRAEAAEQDD